MNYRSFRRGSAVMHFHPDGDWTPEKVRDKEAIGGRDWSPPEVPTGDTPARSNWIRAHNALRDDLDRLAPGRVGRRGSVGQAFVRAICQSDSDDSDVAEADGAKNGAGLEGEDDDEYSLPPSRANTPVAHVPASAPRRERSNSIVVASLAPQARPARRERGRESFIRVPGADAKACAAADSLDRAILETLAVAKGATPFSRRASFVPSHYTEDKTHPPADGSARAGRRSSAASLGPAFGAGSGPSNAPPSRRGSLGSDSLNANQAFIAMVKDKEVAMMARHSRTERISPLTPGAVQPAAMPMWRGYSVLEKEDHTLRGGTAHSLAGPAASEDAPGGGDGIGRRLGRSRSDPMVAGGYGSKTVKQEISLSPRHLEPSLGEAGESEQADWYRRENAHAARSGAMQGRRRSKPTTQQIADGLCEIDRVRGMLRKKSVEIRRNSLEASQRLQRRPQAPGWMAAERPGREGVNPLAKGKGKGKKYPSIKSLLKKALYLRL